MTEASFDEAPVAAENFHVGRVFSRSFAIVKQNLVKLLVLAAIPLLLYFAAVYVIRDLSAAGGSSVLSGPPMIRLGTGIAASSAISVLVFFLDIFAQVIVVYGAFQAARGQSFYIAESFSWGCGRLPAFIAVILISGIAFAVSALALIIPGVIVYCMVYVALPACLVEGLGPFVSVGRSAELTKGCRWRILGVAALVLLIKSVLAALILAPIALLRGPVGGGSIADFLWQMIGGMLETIVVVVTYHELRVAKDGIDTDRIAAVFE